MKLKDYIKELQKLNGELEVYNINELNQIRTAELPEKVRVYVNGNKDLDIDDSPDNNEINSILLY